MGGQGIERRDILRYIGIASVAATFPGFHQWAFACPDDASHESGMKVAAAAAPYTPLFFSPQQYRMVEHISEMIIPADDTPGAKEAGVAEFIDFMVANRVAVAARSEIRSPGDAMQQGKEAQALWLSGLAWMNAHSHAEFGHPYMDCSAEQQQSLLMELSYKAKFKPTTESGREFFQLVRDYTVVGFYTTKIGLQSLGYPGLRVVWPKMPGCTHLDDPEHLHLKTPATAQEADPKASAETRSFS